MKLKPLFASVLIAAWSASGSASVSALYDNISPQIANVLGLAENELWGVDNNLYSVLQDSVASVSQDSVAYSSWWKCNIDGNIDDNVIDIDSVEAWSNNGFVFEWSLEVLSSLRDNFTFQQYSEKPWVHGYASVGYSKNNMNLSLSESVYYTLEKDNPMSANFVTDLIWSYDISEELSVGAWAEVSIYPKSKDENMFGSFLMVDYHPNDKFNATVVPYKPICLLNWKKLSDFYFLGTFSCNIWDDLDKKVLFRTMTNCTDNWRTQVALWISKEICDNFSVDLTTIPDEETWIVPRWVLSSLKYTF